MLQKNWALVMMLKALPSLHERFVVKITYDYLSKKTLQTLIKSAQNPAKMAIFFSAVTY